MLNATWTITALLTGLLGSLHCLGMCGPLVLGLHGAGRSGAGGKVVYHLGRIAAYSGLGLLIGTLGAGFEMAGLQRWLSIGLGVVALVMAWRIGWFDRLQALVSGRTGRLIGSGMRSVRGRKGWPPQAAAGFLNGLLPCGFVYLALAAALAVGSPGQGAIFMGLFGLGTLPAMLAVSLSGGWLGKKLRFRAAPVLRTWMAIFGLLLILRGLDLGVPFLSPQLPDQVTEEVDCH